MTPWATRYRDACLDAINRYPASRDGQTFCNLGVQYVCAAMGCPEFAGLLANQIHAALEADENWRKMTGNLAAWWIERTKALAVASWSNKDGPGHCAMVFPGPLGYSGKWGYTEAPRVPLVANVGKKNGVLPANKAFTVEPNYYVKVLLED